MTAGSAEIKNWRRERDGGEKCLSQPWSQNWLRPHFTKIHAVAPKNTSGTLADSKSSGGHFKLCLRASEWVCLYMECVSGIFVQSALQSGIIQSNFHFCYSYSLKRKLSYWSGLSSFMDFFCSQVIHTMFTICAFAIQRDHIFNPEVVIHPYINLQ